MNDREEMAFCFFIGAVCGAIVVTAIWLMATKFWLSENDQLRWGLIKYDRETGNIVRLYRDKEGE